jgi:protein TonB
MPRGLVIALSLSVAAHLVAAVLVLAPAVSSHTAGNTVISIRLVPAALSTAAETTPEPAPSPGPVARPLPPSPPALAGTPRARATAAAEPPTGKPVPEAQARHTHPGPAEPQAVDSRVISDSLRQQVGQLLSEHFHYPRLARSRGWEGIVELGLHIAADGRVSHVILHRRSAYPTLDRAALVAAGHLRTVPGAAALLDQDGLELVVPVHYRLIDS